MSTKFSLKPGDIFITRLDYDALPGSVREFIDANYLNHKHDEYIIKTKVVSAGVTETFVDFDRRWIKGKAAKRFILASIEILEKDILEFGACLQRTCRKRKELMTLLEKL